MKEKSIEFIYRKLLTLGRIFEKAEINETQYTAKCYEIFKKAYFLHEAEINNAYNDGNSDGNYYMQGVPTRFLNADDYFTKTYPES
jgi:hypothetical protein